MKNEDYLLTFKLEIISTFNEDHWRNWSDLQLYYTRYEIDICCKGGTYGTGYHTTVDIRLSCDL